MIRDTGDTNTLLSGLRILMRLELSTRPVPADYFIKEWGIARSTVYRHLKVLTDSGWALRTREGYVPGPLITNASTSPAEQVLESEDALSILRQLSYDIQETCIVTVVRWPDAYALLTAEAPHALRYSFSRGTRHPLYAGASARVLLAFQPAALLSLYAEAIPLPGSGPDWPTVKEQLALIRKNGYAVSYGEVDPGVAAVGVPVFGAAGQLLAALSVVGPDFRFKPLDALPVVQRTADALADLVAATLSP